MPYQHFIDQLGNVISEVNQNYAPNDNVSTRHFNLCKPPTF